MKRPQLLHFLPILTDNKLSVKASIALTKVSRPKPIRALKLLKSNRFKLKLVLINNQQQEIESHHLRSDAFGNFSFTLPIHGQEILLLKVYEITFRAGIEFYMGSFAPLDINKHRGIIISDLDKTLIETQYSNIQDIYNSLTSELDEFPLATQGLSILQSYTKQNFCSFILSASPHFYETAIKYWLDKNSISTAGIFLKDYRHFFSYFQGLLSPKDITTQGLYKIYHLVEILLMTGIPRELILLGDNYESDPLIYLIFAAVLQNNLSPPDIWRAIRQDPAFKLNRKQDRLLLSKLYQLKDLMREKKIQPIIKIYIRKIKEPKELPADLPTNLIEWYQEPNR